jgi:DNA primase
VIGLVPSFSTKNFLELSTRSYMEQLQGSPVEEHLLSRGITKEAQTFFRLGYVGNPLKGHEKYSGSLSIPYITGSGVVTLRFRTFGRGAKYLSLPGAVGRPFGVGLLGEEAPVYIVEGELDAISCWIAGLPTVGFPGANTWAPVFSRIFRFRSVVVVADGDEPGMRFAEEVARDIERCDIISCPPGEDANSILVSQGPEGLRNLVGADT